MRDYALSYLTIPGATPPEQVEIAAAAGYSHASFRLIHLNVAGEPDINPTSSAVIHETRAALARTGLKCFDIELARIHRDVDPQSFLPAFEAGAKLGARQVICSAWTDVRNDRAFIVDRFSEICALARSFGLTVNLEFPAFSRLTTMDDCIEILELADCPNQGLLADTLYMHFNKTPLFALERVPARWINFLHICDAANLVFTKDEMIHIARDARLYPGEGAIDFSALNLLFPDLPLALELPNAARSAELGHAEHARICLTAAKAVFEGFDANPDIRNKTWG